MSASSKLLSRIADGLSKAWEQGPVCQCHQYGDVGRQRDAYVAEYGRVLLHLLELGHDDYVAGSIDRAQSGPQGRVEDLAWERQQSEAAFKRRQSVDCPLCGAKPGAPCVIVPGHKTSGKPLAGGAHHKARHRNADHIFYENAGTTGNTGSDTTTAQEG